MNLRTARDWKKWFVFMSNSRTLSIKSGILLILVSVAYAAGVCVAEPSVAEGDEGATMIKQGEYLATLGDCAACHTAAGGHSMAGGVAFSTPFGVIYSTNITPDRKTGIGQYSFAQFDRALRRGIADDGQNLYPAMPYPSFSRISSQDMRALYAYFMRGVAPIQQANRENDVDWPFNIRNGLSVWNMVFGDERQYEPDPARSAQWNRGAYIVEGLGHCGSCHTPRGVAFQEKAMSQTGSDGNQYLSGATVDEWHAPSLRNHWAAPEIVRFLKTGRNGQAAAYGSMTEVVHNSTQLLTDGDLSAMAEYLSSLPVSDAGGTEKNGPAPSSATTAQALYGTSGGLGYVQFCSTCHGTDGRGVSDLFPPLAGNSSIQSQDPASVIHVLLSGWVSAKTVQYPRAFDMPGFRALTDGELADIATFIRSSWGNRAEPIRVGDVKAMRKKLDVLLGEQPKDDFEVPRFAAMLDRPNAKQLILGMRLMVETKVTLANHVGDTLSCSSCHLNGGTVSNAAPYVGLAAVFPSYAKRSGATIDFKDRINGCLRRSMNGKPLEKDSQEMLAMVAYVDWMRGPFTANTAIPGRGVGKISEDLIADEANGQHIYRDQCAVCHGDHGDGKHAADGQQIFPPLWGNDSFNIGAGIARTYTAASFVKNNMPIANSLKFPLGQGGLTDQEAVDVAAYFTHQPRPDFPDKFKDWPDGGKPKDARY